jgi:hypothetical protein
MSKTKEQYLLEKILDLQSKLIREYGIKKVYRGDKDWKADQ